MYNLCSNFPSFGWSLLNIYYGGRVRGDLKESQYQISKTSNMIVIWSKQSLCVVYALSPSCQPPNSLSNYFKFINEHEEYLDDLQDIYAIILSLPLLLQQKQHAAPVSSLGCLPSRETRGQQHPVHFNKLLMMIMLLYYISDKPSPYEASFHIFYYCSILVLILSIFLLFESSRTFVSTNYCYFNFTHIFELHS